MFHVFKQVLWTGAHLFLPVSPLFLFVCPLPFISVIMYRKEMEKYRDVDEDELLQNLSEEELRRLEDELEELDPDVSILKIWSVLYCIISNKP